MKLTKKDKRDFLKMNWNELLSFSYAWIHLGHPDYGLEILTVKKEKPPKEYIIDYYELKLQAALVSLDETDDPKYADNAIKYLFSLKYYDQNHKYLKTQLLVKLKLITVDYD